MTTTIETLVAAERYRYLSLLTPSAFRRTTLFAMPHQTVLRLLCGLHGKDVDELISKYYRQPVRRLRELRALQDSMAELQAADGSSFRKTAWSWAHYASNVQDYSAAFRRLAGAKGDNSVWFATRSGFGIFEKGTPIYRDGRTFMTLPDSNMASTDAMEYYAFSKHPEPSIYFLQVPSIELFGKILHQHLTNPLPPDCHYQWWEQRAVEELRGISLDGVGLDEIITMTYELFMAHELGHSLQMYGLAPILDMVREFGVSDEELFRGGIPTEYELASWSRIVEGKGTVQDVSFVLGDLFANATVWLTGATERMLRMLRAFTWLLVRPTREKAVCPRGNIAFLRFSGQDDSDALMKTLRLVLRTAVEKPASLAEVLWRWQCEDWGTLESMYRT